MKQTREGYCNFGDPGGKTRFVTWTVITDDEEKKLSFRGGHIVYLELSVDGETRAAFDHGHWVKRPISIQVLISREDAIAHKFVKLLTDLYN